MTLKDKIVIYNRNKIEDSRGWFLKAITGLEEGLPNHTGEVYIVSSEQGASRGGHYHKEAIEWFILLTGCAKLELKDVRTNELMTIELDAAKPKTIVIPPFIAHRFDAKGQKSFLLLAYTNVIFKQEDTISLSF